MMPNKVNKLQVTVLLLLIRHFKCSTENDHLFLVYLFAW